MSTMIALFLWASNLSIFLLVVSGPNDVCPDQHPNHGSRVTTNCGTRESQSVGRGGLSYL